MQPDWVPFIDYAICASIILVLIGQRFNQWPGLTPNLFSGKPSDYIDPFRYYAFFAIYICAFLVLGFAISNLKLPMPASLKSDETFRAIAQQLGSQSWTVAALYMLAFVSEKHVEKYDAMWRNHLQAWARIPKAVEELKANLMSSEDALNPTPDRLEDLRSEMKRLHVESHWESVIANWQRERAESTLEWHFVKAMYGLRICKQLRVFNPADIERHEKRLHDLARVLPKIDTGREDVDAYMEEVHELYSYFLEGLCKHVIRKNPSKTGQREAMQNIGFRVRFYDVPEIRVFKFSMDCLLCIGIACFVTIAAYLLILDVAGLHFSDNETWFTWQRLRDWSIGSFVSYGMAIFIAVIIEKATMAQESEPGLMTYLTVMIFSTLVSLTFFRFTNPNTQLNWSAYLSLALSMGVVAVAVIWALTKPTCATRKECWTSSVYHALLLGLLASVFQTLAAVSFRGVDVIKPKAMVITAGYGFVKGAVVTLIVSYLIQESIRRQLLMAQRTAPRVRFKVRLSASFENEELLVTTRNVSRGGLLIEPSKPLRQGQLLNLNFAFGAVQARVKWVNKKFAGVAFTQESPNIDELLGFIRNRFRVALA